jgi:hypothetical protein
MIDKDGHVLLDIAVTVKNNKITKILYQAPFNSPENYFRKKFKEDDIELEYHILKIEKPIEIPWNGIYYYGNKILFIQWE